MRGKRRPTPDDTISCCKSAFCYRSSFLLLLLLFQPIWPVRTHFLTLIQHTKFIFPTLLLMKPMCFVSRSAVSSPLIVNPRCCAGSRSFSLSSPWPREHGPSPGQWLTARGNRVETRHLTTPWFERDRLEGRKGCLLLPLVREF